MTKPLFMYSLHIKRINKKQRNTITYSFTGANYRHIMRRSVADFTVFDIKILLKGIWNGFNSCFYV